MTIETSLIFGLILHGVGDYITQNNWLATNKTKRSKIGIVAAMIHALVYGLPFLFITSYLSASIIITTHFLIDHFRLARYWIMIVNMSFNPPLDNDSVMKIRLWRLNIYLNNTSTGYSKTMPIWLSTWLLFIIDNMFHVAINTMCIYTL